MNVSSDSANTAVALLFGSGRKSSEVYNVSVWIEEEAEQIIEARATTEMPCREKVSERASPNRFST
jgi:hypothetical protein